MGWAFYTSTGVNKSTQTPYDWTVAQTLVEKTADYTLTNADVGYLVTVNSATAKNITVATTLGMTAGQRIDIMQTGAGQVTVVASSTTVNASPTLKLRAQYSAATLICTATNTYVLVGDLAVS